MPLFLRPDRYINVPLESTYQEAYRRFGVRYWSSPIAASCHFSILRTP
jgi:hypothetical protein